MKTSILQVSTRIGARREGDLGTLYCDPSLAYEKLGWKAVYDIDDMTRDVWKWQAANPSGYSSVESRSDEMTLTTTMFAKSKIEQLEPRRAKIEARHG